jgi:hypothetical protein
LSFIDVRGLVAWAFVAELTSGATSPHFLQRSDSPLLPDERKT